MFGIFGSRFKKEETLQRVAQMRVMVDRALREVNDDIWHDEYLLGFSNFTIAYMLKGENGGKSLNQEAAGMALGECGQQLTGMGTEQYQKLIYETSIKQGSEWNRGGDNAATWMIFTNGTPRRGHETVEEIIEAAKAMPRVDDSIDDVAAAAAYLFHRDVINEAIRARDSMRDVVDAT